MGQQYTHLSAEERGTIMALQVRGASGLAIAQQLSRALDGSLRLSNRDGGGLEATITLAPRT